MVKKSPENTTPAIVDNVEALEAKLAQMREAQALFATYTQEQVDKIFYEAAMAANKARIPLAKMAIEETGRGVLEDKVIKNHYAAEYIYNAYKNTKTCGVLERDEAYGITKIAEPIGIVGAVIPTTNPTSTAIFKTLISLKTRNAIIISPHPAAAKCTIAAAKLVLDAAVKAGAPEGIIGWVDVPSIELTNMVMRDVDIILATGGPGMVKAAYSSGKPALGVGAGNTPVVIDDTADVLLAVNSIIHSKTFDNGMICASEQSVTVIDTIYDQVKAEFQKRGCYFVKQGAEMEALRAAMFKNGALDHRIPGMAAAKIAELAGIEVPAKTKILIAEVTSTDPAKEEFSHEKLSPVLAMYHAKDFQEAVDKAEHLVLAGGPGHTASLYVHPAQAEKISLFEHVMKACRIVINTPSSHGGIGDLYNFGMKPSLTLGCGSWGGNSISENVGVKHLITLRLWPSAVRTCCGSALPRRSTSRRVPRPSPSTSSVPSWARSAPSSSPTSSSSRMATPAPSRPSLTRWASPTTASTTSSPIRRCSAHVAAPSRWLSLSRTSSSPSAVAPLWTPARSCG